MSSFCEPGTVLGTGKCIPSFYPQIKWLSHVNFSLLRIRSQNSWSSRNKASVLSMGAGGAGTNILVKLFEKKRSFRTECEGRGRALLTK